MPERFGVIVADPNWKYKNFSKAVHGAVEAHYETSNLKELAKLRKPMREQWAADDCVLAMWCTWPKLDDGIPLIHAFGFEYKTAFPWIKTLPTSGNIRTGIGFWKQSASEVLLIGARGNPSRKTEKQPGIGLVWEETRQFYAPLRRNENGRIHSTKPEDVQGWLEREFEGPYLELFATRERPGWTCWGKDTGWWLDVSGARRIEKVNMYDTQEVSKPELRSAPW